MAVVLRKIGQLEKALECSKKALDINPNNVKFWFNMGKIYEAMDDHKMAEKCFEVVAELNS